MASTQELIQKYFRSKTRELIAIVQGAICEHSSLLGSHREEVLRVYLRDLLPKRFSVGHGMIYGMANHSKECDIVIWDSQNYPSLKMAGHDFFFAESVRTSLEIKTNWNSDEMSDIMGKCKAIHRIISVHLGRSIVDTIDLIQMEIEAIKTNQTSQGFLMTPYRIGTSAIAFFGGERFDIDSFDETLLSEIDDGWPDTLLLLNAGKIILKIYEPNDYGFGGRSYLEIIDAGEDALLIFTAAFQGILNDRSVQIENPFYLASYIEMIVKDLPSRQIDFPSFGPMPSRQPIWG